MNRGDVYWVNLNPTKSSEIRKIRPCVILSATPINKARRTVVVIPLSTSVKSRPPLTIELNCMNKKVVAVCDQIRAVDKSRLTKYAETLHQKDLSVLEDGLKQVLCLG